MLKNKNITGLILAGGKSSRMGVDKGFILYKDKPFIKHSIDALKPLVNKIIIVSDHIQYDSLGYKRINDVLPETGPLSGLYSGLLQSDSDLNLVLSCDIPLISSVILTKLLTAYTEGTNAVVCKVNKRVMPLVALYHKNCIGTCEALLKRDERRMMRLLETLDRVAYLELNEEQAKQVKNINNSKDLNDIKHAN